MIFEIQLLLALVLDLCFGDPRWLPHPVRLIGMLAEKVERLTRRHIGNFTIGGGVSVLMIVGMTGGVTWLLLFLSATVSSALSNTIAVILLYLSIAIKDLIGHSREVYQQLAHKKDMEQARIAVAKIVGRDTRLLKEGGVIKACVESVAENMVDGITAPVFWAIIATFFSSFFGMSEIGLAAIGALIYKSINTLDSMFGYRNEKYIQFGWAAAKLDDLVNWPVARLSGLTLVIASFCLGLEWKRALKIYIRDRLKHSSPNAAHSEAAVAGALGIKLGGSSVYHGKTVYKPTIGEATRRVTAADILLTNRIVLAGSFIFVLFMVTLRQFVLIFLV